jgi:hypothetical protein
VTPHLIARFLGCKVWELETVAVHYQDEAALILQAQYETRMHIAKTAKCSPEKIILPEF